MSELAGDLEVTADGEKAIKAIAAELHRRGVTPEEVGKVRRISMWQTVTKNAEHEAELHDLHGFQLAPSWDEGPEWPVVQPADPVRVTPVKPKTRPADRRTIIFPDPQIGFRRLDDGTMIEMHDWTAMHCGLALARAAGCEAAVNLGDTLDLAEWSVRWAVLPEFVGTTTSTLNDSHRFLAEQRAFIEDVKLLEGNHDERISTFVNKNAKAALRLKQAAATPESWPVLSVPFLLRLDELGVEYVGGYPAGRIQVAAGNEYVTPLHAIHGEKLDIAKVAKTERQSFVQGHVHRIARHEETYELDGRPVVVRAFSVGCLCKTDGTVPSFKGGTDARGVPVRRWEDWQQGVGIISEWDDGTWVPEIAPIHAGRALWRGKAYEA